MKALHFVILLPDLVRSAHENNKKQKNLSAPFHVITSDVKILSDDPSLKPVVFMCFYRKNASRSWHDRNLTASRTHMMMKFLPRHPTRSSKPAAAEEVSAPRCTRKKMLSATCARSVLERWTVSETTS